MNKPHCYKYINKYLIAKIWMKNVYNIDIFRWKLVEDYMTS